MTTPDPAIPFTTDTDHFLDNLMAQAARAQECAVQRGAVFQRAQTAIGLDLMNALQELRQWNDWIAGTSQIKPQSE